MLKSLPWEQISLDGEVAFLHKFKNIKCAASPLKDTAIQKLTDVAAISAEFNREYILYFPYLWVLFDYDDSNVEFYGVYLPDEPYNATPNICLRKGIWKRASDREQTQYNKNYEKYVWSTKHTQASMFFYHMSELPKIEQLIQSFGDYLTTRMNFKLPPSQEILTERHSCLIIKLYNQDFVLGIEYSPLFRREVLLEEQAELWKKYFLELNFESSIKPDKNTCKLSYFPSVMERLAIYDESL